MKKKLLEVMAAVWFLLLVMTATQAQSPITLTITNSPGYTIPDDFAGLGFETRSELPDTNGVSGYFFSPTNTQLITLFRNLGFRNLRMGGGSVDGTNAAHPSNADIASLFGFAQAAGVKVIYSLQLKNGDTNVAALTAKYIWENYRPQLDLFAIGNEPQTSSYFYPPYGTGTDPVITNYSSYLADWRAFASAVTNAAPGATFAGPDSAGLLNTWAGQFADDERSSRLVALITQHHYPGGRPGTNTTQSAIDNMLSTNWLVALYPQYVNQLSRVVTDGYPYRLTESNDYITGITNASDAFAAALWALDYLHWWAAQGCAGLNFHNKQWLLTDTVYLNEQDGSYQIHPKAYALKAFDLGSHGRVEPVTMNNPADLNLTAYAVADPTNLYVTLINKEHGAGARGGAVTLLLKGFSPGEVAAMYLIAPNGDLSATSGVTLGGASITNNAPWQGQWTSLGSISNGQFTLAVSAGSAVVLKMAVTPSAPVITQDLPAQVPLVAGKIYTYRIGASSSSPFGYQWYEGGVPLGGQTGATYTLMADSPGSSTYSVVVTNDFSAVTSVVSTLTVIPQLADYYATQVLSNRPRGYWPLQETNAASAVTIETNYGTLGALGNAYYLMANATNPAFGQAGILAGSSDGAVAFNQAGTGGCAFVPRLSPAMALRPPFSLECWIKSSSTAFGDLLGEGGSGLNRPPNTGDAGGARMSYGGDYIGGPNLQLYIYTGGGITVASIHTPGNSLPPGAWHYCVATFDGATANLYVDGVQEASGLFTMAPDTWSPLTIGAGLWSGAGPQYYYNGLEDEVAVYTNVLTADQINSHYLAGINAGSNYSEAVLSGHPLLYYRMNCPGYVNGNPLFYPVAVNYGSAPANGAYLPGTIPGGLAGPPILTLAKSPVAAPINGVFSCVDAGQDPTFNPAGTHPFTAMAWFRTYPSDGRMQTIMSHGGNSSWALNLSGTNGLVVWSSGAGVVSSTAALNDGEWHFAAGVYDGAKNYLYVDGVLNNSAAASGVVAGNTSDDVLLGGDPDYTSVGDNQRYFAGAIAQAAFFTTALSAAKVQAIYQAGITPPPPITLAVGRFGTGQVQLSWNYGALQYATDAVGPYNDVFAASSPCQVPATNAQEFYRVRGN